jgi:cytochrome c biogenesis protein CcdA
MGGRHTTEWRAAQVLAWTEREGPGRPPAGPNRPLAFGLAGALGVVFVGMLATDALCPEHRAWVQVLAGTALIGTGAAVVGLLRGWAVAPLLTLAVASCGVAIGGLDAVHDPTRGTLLVVAFGLVTLASCWLGLRQARLVRWERAVKADLAPADISLASNDAATADTPAGDEPALRTVR